MYPVHLFFCRMIYHYLTILLILALIDFCITFEISILKHFFSAVKALIPSITGRPLCVNSTANLLSPLPWRLY